VRALSILTEEYATRVTGMQSTNRSADIDGQPNRGFGDRRVRRRYRDPQVRRRAGDLRAL
jgi:hypothetical protein